MKWWAYILMVAAVPAIGSGWGFEFRTTKLPDEQELSFHQHDKFGLKLPGKFEGPESDFEVGAMGFRADGIVLKRISGRLSGRRWTYSAGAGPLSVSITCTNIRLAFYFDEAVLPFASSTEFSAETNESGAAKIHLSTQPFDVVAVFRALPFSPATINDPKHLSFSADCQGGHFGVAIGDLARAWLENVPLRSENRIEHDTSTFLDTLNAHISDGLSKWSLVIPPDMTPVARQTYKFSFSHTDREWIFRTEPFFADAVSPVARSQYAIPVTAPAPTASGHLNVFIPANGTVRLSDEAIFDLGMESEFWDKDGIVHMKVKQFATRADLQAYFAELGETRGDEAVQVDLAFADCRNEVSSMRIRPWISQLGREKGFEADFPARFEVRDMTGQLLARRMINMDFDVVLGRAAGWITRLPKYRGVSPPCETIPAVAPEISQTLDWFFSSPALSQLEHQKISGLAPKGTSASFDFRSLGSATLGSRREGGGYWADALVIESGF